MASTQVDIDAHCDALVVRHVAVDPADASVEWPVLTLDVDSKEGVAPAVAPRPRSLEAPRKKSAQPSQLDAVESSLVAILDRLSRLELAPPPKVVEQHDGNLVG